MNTRQKIYSYFENSPQLKVLFVFDPMGGISYEIEDGQEEWPEDYVYHVFEGNWFTMKVRLTEEWADKKVVLVFGQMQPESPEACRNFPLMGVLEANMAFHEEDAVAFMQQRGIPMQFSVFFHRHMGEVLRDKFNDVLAPYYDPAVFSHDLAYRGLLSVYLGSSKMLEWYRILARIITMTANDESKAQALFSKLSEKGSKSAQDVGQALIAKLNSFTEIPINRLSIEDMTRVVESIKYNAIIQEPAVVPADPYKSLKIANSVKLQEINAFLQSVNENSRLRSQFQPAFEKLGEAIKETTLIDVYGADAKYSYINENLCKPIITKIVETSLYSNPAEVVEILRGLKDKVTDNQQLVSEIDFLLSTAKYYEKANSIASTKLNTPDIYIAAYTESLFNLDKSYRQAIGAYSNLKHKSGKIEQIKRKLDTDYAELTNEINLEWIRCIKEVGIGFETIKSVPRQWNFYGDFIKGKTQKVAVIISDALRYELAEELLQRLTSKKHMATLTAALSSLPTETKYTKPTLLPYETLGYADSNLLVDGKVLGSTDSRAKQLQKYIPDGVCIDYKELMKMSRDEKRAVFRKPVVYVFHNTLDESAHGCTAQTFTSAWQTALDELESLIPFIHDTCNVADIYLTADHGFLYNDITFEEKDKQVISEPCDEKKSRYYLNDNLLADFGITKFNLEDVSGMTDTVERIGVPTGTNRLAAPAGDYEFAHGGAALQELIIPILNSKYQRDNTKQKVGVALMEQVLPITSSRLKAHLIQTEAVSMDYQERTIKCAVYVNDTPVSQMLTLPLNSTDEEMGASRIIPIDLTVTQSASSKIMQLRVYDKDDMFNPLLTKNIINNTLIEQDDF